MTEAADLKELRSTVRGFLEHIAPARSQLADDPSIWKRLTAELGLTGLAVPEAQGGSGASFVELAVVLEEAGRCLLRAPLLSTAVAAAVLGVGDGADLLPALLDGSTSAAFVVGDISTAGAGRDLLSGSVPQVVDAAAAGLLLVTAGDTLYAVDAAIAVVRPAEALDPTRPLAGVELDGTHGRPVGDSAYALDLLHVALAAESVGAARRVLEMTVDYLKVREQFGRPLGSFQALRHRIADLTVELEAATSTVWYAARAAATGAPDLPVVAPLAKATAQDAFTHVAGEAIQLHGGIGFTWEHDAHLFFKRAWTTALLHGDSRTLRRTAYDRSRRG
ncbi:MAG: acyl-CoA dehydrogenase domain protein [Frankiales bacterium]|nr:acyl-CoA dehydrogenase domain protein [Frankiales bacterium]